MKKSLCFLSVFFLCSLFVGCSPQNSRTKIPLFSVWSGGGFINDKTDEQISAHFQKMAEAKVFGMFLETSNENYKRVIPLAKKHGIEIHAWRWTMNNGAFLQSYPECSQVNRLGESCATNPPYVDYYRWMCPNDTNVQNAVIENYVELAQIKGLASIHFDYVRFCDVFLPVGLLPKYNLIQDHVMPEFDYCYCNRCINKFKTESGLDAMNLVTQEDSASWMKFRLNSVVELVNRISKRVHQETSTLVTAAVFPTPKMSAHMVRQDWGKFEIDAVFPMLYHGFYNQDVNWVGECVKEGIETMEVKKDLIVGTFLPDCTTPEKLQEVIDIAMSNGAKGVSVFDQEGTLFNSSEYTAVIQKSYEKYNK